MRIVATLCLLGAAGLAGSSQETPHPGAIHGLVRFTGTVPPPQRIITSDGAILQHSDLVVDAKTKGLKHVVAYLTDFLFSSKRALAPIAALSGGERNRVILAKLFTRPVNLLVLDEPTNDLDVETLEALEDRLAEYEGTLIVVSHDRYFLDAVVTSTLVFEADGQVRRHAGGYSDWLLQRPAPVTAAKRPEPQEKPKPAAAPRPRGFDAKLQRELDRLPERMSKVEAAIAAVEDRLADVAFYARDPGGFARATEELERLRHDLAALEERWLELETLREAATTAQPG